MILRYGKFFNRLSRSLPHVRQQSAGIETRPYQYKIGIIPVFILSVTGMYVGAMAAKKGAEILEQFNIFTPEDYDDWTKSKRTAQLVTM